jgi:hypothetical protein
MKWFSDKVREALDKAEIILKDGFIRKPVCPTCNVILFPYIALATVKFLAYDQPEEQAIVPVWACPTCDYVKPTKWGLEVWEWCSRVEPLSLRIIYKELTSLLELGYDKVIKH